MNAIKGFGTWMLDVIIVLCMWAIAVVVGDEREDENERPN